MSATREPSVASTGKGGPSRLLIATAVGGGTGYVVMLIAGKAFDPATFAAFGVFWSALYLVIGALSGIQQEIARATRAVPLGDARANGSVVRTFAVWTVLVVFGVTLASAWFWVGAVFPKGGWAFVLPLAVGAAAYVVVASIAGMLYGLSMWTSIAGQVSFDGLLRLVLVGSLLLLTAAPTLTAWAVVVPIILTPIVVWPFVRRRIAGRVVLDVGIGELAWNVIRTVIASAATGVMVSGLPLFLKATSQNDSAAEIGAVLFSISLLRAPVVIVVMSMQSFLVVFFRARRQHIWRTLGPIVLVVLGGAALLGLLAWWLGPTVVVALFGEPYRLDGWLLGVLVATAGPLGALCATGSAALALGKHGAFTSGWVVAALVTLATLLVPNSLDVRTSLAMTVGPIIGLLVHVVLIARATAKLPNSPAEPQRP
ncbi:hypothetical protein [Plantibacter sp. YIM 135347]|uniref:hypothetical protein n=1 Tax=Plantibacter sp. YIM 135347 TaxID=3423919 RepID=UPI003D33E131